MSKMVNITLPMQEKIAKLIEALFNKDKIAIMTLTRLANVFHITADDLIDDTYILQEKDFWVNLRENNEIEKMIEAEKEVNRSTILKLDEIGDSEDEEIKRFYYERKAELETEYSDPKRKGFIIKYLFTEIETLLILREIRMLRLKLGSSTYTADEYKRLVDMYRIVSGVHNTTGDRFETVAFYKKQELEEDKAVIDAAIRKKQEQEWEKAENALLNKKKKEMMR